jgi:hypothetical protein
MNAKFKSLVRYICNAIKYVYYYMYLIAGSQATYG